MALTPVPTDHAAPAVPIGSAATAGPAELDGELLTGSAAPLRRDAERNRQRLLVAARDLFAQRGLAVTLDDVAAAAGVGVGTAYRRFANKDALIEAVFADRMEGLVALAERAQAIEDPWESFAWLLEQFVLAQAVDRGLRMVMETTGHMPERVREARDRIKRPVSAVVERAQAAGQLRADLSPRDVPLLTKMLTSVADYMAGACPEVWRRYLAILLDGLRAGAPAPLLLPASAPSDSDMEIALTGRRVR